MEEIRAEMNALGARIRDPDTPPAERLAARLHILNVLMPEMWQHGPDEDEASDFEVVSVSPPEEPRLTTLAEEMISLLSRLPQPRRAAFVSELNRLLASVS